MHSAVFVHDSFRLLELEIDFIHRNRLQDVSYFWFK
jgi:hypothetical protein